MRSDVREAQRILNELGYDAGPVDGAYGGRTRRALIAFQQDEGLPVNGEISDQVLVQLRRTEARMAPTGNPALAHGGCTPIRFARGTSAAEITGVAPADGVLCYTLATLNGQTASIEVIEGNNVIFTVLGLFDAANRYQFITEQKTYEVRVGQLMRAVAGVSFRIRVGVTDAAREALSGDDGRVAEAQQLLNRLGYGAGPADGKMGPATRRAIRDFQRESGLGVTGRLDHDGYLISALHTAEGGGAASGGGLAVQPSPSPTVPTSLATSVRHGIFWIDGRVAVLSRSGYLKVDEPAPPQDNLENALLAVIGKDIDFSRLDDATVVGLFYKRFDPEGRKEILSIALQRPLTNSENRQLESGLFGGVTSGLQDPFAQMRAADEIRKRLPVRYSEEPLSQPVPLRVYCSASVDPYDFASSSFPLLNRCGELKAPLWVLEKMNITGSQAPLPEPGGGFPAALPMTPERAEAFQDEAWRGLVISFETDMTVTSRMTEAGMVVSISYSAPVNHVVHKGKSATEIAFPLNLNGAREKPAEIVSEERTWITSNKQDMMDLAKLSGAPKLLPFDGRTIAWPGGDTLGKVVFSRGGSIFGSRPEDIDNRTVELFYGQWYGGTPLFDDLINSLYIPREHINMIARYGNNDPISAVFAILPAEYRNYTITAPDDKYGRSSLAAHAVLDVKGVHTFRMPTGTAPVLVLSVVPVEGRFTEVGRGGAVIERFDIHRDSEPPVYDILDIPPRYNLVRAIGTAYGVDVEEIMGYKMRHPKGLSSFDIQKRIEEVLAASAASASNGAMDYWIGGTVRLREYDFRSKTFPVHVGDYGIGLPDMLREPELTKDVISTAFLDRKYLKVTIDPGKAEEFAKRIQPPVELPYRVLVRPRQASQSSYGRLRVSVVAVYGEILDKNAVLTIDNPSRVVYRFGTRPDAVAPSGAGTGPSMTRDEAVAFLVESIDENETYAMIRRRGAVAVSEVLTNSVQTRDYLRIVKDEALDMPDAFAYGFPVKIAEKFRNDPNAMLLLRTRRLMEEGLQAKPIREVLITLAQEFDLVIGSFPPKREIVANGVTRLEDLLAGNPRTVVVRRRDDTGPITTVYASKGGRASLSAHYASWSVDLAMISNNAKKFGYIFQPELPKQVKWLDLREIPKLLRKEDNSAIVLSSEDIKKIFNKISDMDLVGRRFPLEEVYFGIPKDHKRTAKDFSVLGISGGMGRAAALAALEAEFGQGGLEGAQSDVVVAGGEACTGLVFPRSGESDEAGQRCVQVVFDGDTVRSISLHQVMAGDLEDPLLEALMDRYGRSPFMKETRFLEAGAKRMTQGWGDVISGEREALGRVDAKFPPTVVEAVLWVQDDMTTVFVQLDSVPTIEEEQAAKAPKIRF